MEIKFIETDLQLTKENLFNLSENNGTNTMILKIRFKSIVKHSFIETTYEDKEKIVLLKTYKDNNLIILGNNIFYYDKPNEKIIGCCPLCFSEEDNKILKL